MITVYDHLRRVYEEVPYPGVADSESRIRYLQALAMLHGIPAADVRGCRVLELGCAAGRNLIPQAAEFPGSQFLGADFSAAEVAAGGSIIADLSLDNIELRQAGIEQVDTSWGQFDYILCLGVFSWVTADLQAKLLSICRENLAPHGVALISFNAYPGWHLQTVVRDLLRYHAAAFGDRRQQISEARSLLEFVADQTPATMVQGRVFQDARDYLRTARDEYLFHEYLVDDNHPLYLHQFVGQAEAVGLQFVSDAELWRMSGVFMPTAVQPVLANTPLVPRCQLLDFLRNEKFHKVLLCHQPVPLRRNWDLDTLNPFYVTLAQKPKPVAINVADGQPVGIEFPFGTLTVSQPLGKAAIKYLIDHFPAAVSLDQLHAATLTAVQATSPAYAQSAGGSRTLLAQSMLGALQAGLLKTYLHPPQFCDHVSRRPSVTPLARCMATRGRLLVNQVHENVMLDPLQTFLVPQLDGSRDVSELIGAAQQAIADGRLTPPPGNLPLSKTIETALIQLCDAILLVG